MTSLFPSFIAAIAAGLIVLFAVSASLIKFVKRRQMGAPPVNSVGGGGNNSELVDAT